MTKRFLLLAAAVALCCCAAVHADPVTPANLVVTNFTDVSSIEFASSATFYQGDTLSLSNSVIYAGATTNSDVQNLEGCTITVLAGSDTDTSLVTTVSGSAVSTNLGTYTASFTIPACDPVYIEAAVSNGSIRTYEQLKINTRKHLGE